MIKLNKLTDYAVVILTRMSQSERPVWTASVIARETGVPVPTVSKLIKLLVKSQLLVSQRGATGGCELARPAAEISIADVIAAIEGPIALTDCVDGGSKDCVVESVCPMRGNWEKVNQAIRGALQSVSIADMAMPSLFGEAIAEQAVAGAVAH